MSRFIKTQVPLLIMGLMLAAPRVTFACSACMGRGDNSTTQGLNAAILTLLGTLTLVLGSVVGFIAYLIQRSVKHPLAVPSTPGGVAR
jgi:hypothetical protein